jgi:hypothetical protein
MVDLIALLPTCLARVMSELQALIDARVLRLLRVFRIFSVLGDQHRHHRRLQRHHAQDRSGLADCLVHDAARLGHFGCTNAEYCYRRGSALPAY